MRISLNENLPFDIFIQITQKRRMIFTKDTTKIVKVRKNNDGDITDVMLQNGNIFSMNEAIMMAKDNKIEGVNVSKAKNGREFLRSDPNDNEDDNLDNLPTFS